MCAKIGIPAKRAWYPTCEVKHAVDQDMACALECLTGSMNWIRVCTRVADHKKQRHVTRATRCACEF